MSPLGWIHTVAAVAALGFGAAILLRNKGTRSHRRIGWAYVASMLTLNATALFIYRLTGRFGPFHVAALFSILTVALGLLPAVRRKPPTRWVEHHYWWMTYSYLGLLAAAVAEAATRIPRTSFWWTALLASAAVFAVGAPIIARRAGATIAPFLRAATLESSPQWANPANPPH